MRIWHKNLLPILPRMQLVGQWRECSLIARGIAMNGSPNHILVNKVIDYPLEHFATYCYLVGWYLSKNGYIPSVYTEEKISEWLGLSIVPYVDTDILFDGWHNDRYLYQCISNLEEKYDCGGISVKEWKPIEDYICEVM